ncbi:MAG: hypothetical protein JWM23_807 [Microbacteriaceae bacterium]|jgi:hypothetical protein|nr:hypothetical protein [Microbacteriaceae bacterium]
MPARSSTAARHARPRATQVASGKWDAAPKASRFSGVSREQQAGGVRCPAMERDGGCSLGHETERGLRLVSSGSPDRLVTLTDQFDGRPRLELGGGELAR